MKKLRKNMILAVFLSVLAVFLIVLGLEKLSLSFFYKSQAQSMVDLIQDNGGVVPDTEEYETSNVKKNFFYRIDIDEDSAYRTRYFVVQLDQDQDFVSANLDHVASVDQNLAEEMTDAVLDKTGKSGYYENYFYKVKLSKNGGQIIFLDVSREQGFQKIVMIFTAVILGLLLALVILIFVLISGRIIRPFEENAQRQKSFITDASHELKTPLAIISANADVLRYKDGENKWLSNITDQTSEMSRLIGDLLALTKADEVGEEFIREEIDLGSMLREIMLSFQEPAIEKGVMIVDQLPESMQIHGNKDMLKKLFTVLTDNAVKYVKESGEIRYSATSNHKYMKIQIYNSADLPEGFDCSHLFDRFYRPDSSRSSATGGHGIGLSIAKKIVDNHKGRITADTTSDGICFTVSIPL